MCEFIVEESVDFRIGVQMCSVCVLLLPNGRPVHLYNSVCVREREQYARKPKRGTDEPGNYAAIEVSTVR